MERLTTAKSESRTASRWNWALWIVAWSAIVWQVCDTLLNLIGSDFKLAIFTTRGLQTLTAADLGWSERFVVVFIANLPDLCWMLGIFQIVGVSRRFGRGELLTEPILNHVFKFGIALFAMSVTGAFVLPLMNAYLVGRGKIDTIENVWQDTLGSGVLNLLVSAVFVMLLTKILREGIDLREEAELTV